MAKKEKAKAAKAKPEKKSKAKPQKKAKKNAAAVVVERATVLSSEVVYTGPLFRVLHDKIVEPAEPITSAT